MVIVNVYAEHTFFDPIAVERDFLCYHSLGRGTVRWPFAPLLEASTIAKQPRSGTSPGTG